jgi:hypothetical protein
MMMMAAFKKALLLLLSLSDGTSSLQHHDDEQPTMIILLPLKQFSPVILMTAIQGVKNQALAPETTRSALDYKFFREKLISRFDENSFFCTDCCRILYYYCRFCCIVFFADLI